MGLCVTKHSLDRMIQIGEYTDDRVVRRYQSFSTFFYDEMCPAFDELAPKVRRYSFTCGFVASPTALFPVKWFPNKDEFYQMLAISYVNSVHRAIDREMYNRFDDTIDYDNPMVLIPFNDDISLFASWYEMRKQNLTSTWVNGVGNELFKRYGYYYNGLRIKVSVCD